MEMIRFKVAIPPNTTAAETMKGGDVSVMNASDSWVEVTVKQIKPPKAHRSAPRCVFCSKGRLLSNRMCDACGEVSPWTQP